MKKKVLFAASAVALAIVALTSCSDKKEGTDAANAESVVGATDGMEAIAETSDEVYGEAPGQLADETTAPQAGNVTVEEVTADAKEGTSNVIDKVKNAGETAVDKTKEGYEKSKDAVTNAYEKTKDAVKTGAEKTKDFSKNAYEKTKEGVNKAVDKVKNL